MVDRSRALRNSWLTVAALGAAFGVALALISGLASSPWDWGASLAGPWAVVGLAGGAFQRGLRRGALGGTLALLSTTVAYYAGAFVLGGKEPAVMWLVASVVTGAVMGTVGGLLREHARARPWALAGIAAILGGEGFALASTAPSAPLILDGGAYVIYPGTPVFLAEAIVGLLVLAAGLRQPSPRAFLAAGTSFAVIGLVVALEVTTGLARRSLAL